MTKPQQAVNLIGDPERGNIGVNLRSPTGGDLREKKMDRDRLIEIIKCGLSSTAVPYHGRPYLDDWCYGMVMSDFEAVSKPMRGKTFDDENVANVVAYLQTNVIGLGKPTFGDVRISFTIRPPGSAEG